MKLIINNKALQKALKKIGTVVPKRPMAPALEHVMVQAEGNQLTIKATNLEVTILYQMGLNENASKNLNENASKNDTSLINFHWLKGISELHGDEPLYIEALKTYTSVTASSGEYRQEASCKLKDFPVLPEVPGDDSVEMIETFVKWMVSASIFLDTKEEYNRWKGSVYLEIINNHLIITSANARQLFSHTFDIESTLNRSAMIPLTVVKALEGFKETTLFLSDDAYAFKSEGVTIITKIPEGKFPDYNKVIPKDSSENCAVDRIELKEMLDKIKFINPNSVTIIPGPESMELKTKNDSGQSANLTINLTKGYEGESMELSMSPTLLQQLLSQTDYENIGLAFRAPNKALVLSNTKDLSYVGLVMPFMTN